MRVVWSIALKDLRIFVRDRSWIAQLFLVPMLFIVVFSGMLGGLGSSSSDERPSLAVVDLDGGPMAQALLEGVERAVGVPVELLTQEDAQRRLDEGQVPRVLILPAGLSDALASSEPLAVRLVSQRQADAEETEALRLAVESALQELLLEQQVAAALRGLSETEGLAPAVAQVLADERTVQRAREQLAAARERPLITVEERAPSTAQAADADSFDMAQTAVPGFLVLFVFLAAQAMAVSIYDEKRVGSYRRLMAAPISRAQLLLGKGIPNMIIVLVQTVVILGFGTLGFRWLGRQPLQLGSHPLALALLVLAMALCSTGLGMFIAALARTQNQIGGLSSMLLWGTGVLGGSMIPLFLLEQFLGPLPRVVPQYWANRGLENLLLRGVGLEAVWPQIVALLAFALAFFGVGLWRLDHE